MPAIIKKAEIKWSESVPIEFGFSSLSQEMALRIVRKLIEEQWPPIKRGKQWVYVIRLRGTAAMAYPKGNSPVIYIGEGNAYWRLYSHANWITPLLINVPNTQIEVRIAQVLRRKNPTLYKYVEADMIKWFSEIYGAVPLMNSRRERKHEGKFEYEPDTKRSLQNQLSLGKGSAYQWAIKPIGQNELYNVYLKGTTKSSHKLSRK